MREEEEKRHKAEELSRRQAEEERVRKEKEEKRRAELEQLKGTPEEQERINPNNWPSYTYVLTYTAQCVCDCFYGAGCFVKLVINNLFKTASKSMQKHLWYDENGA